MSKRISESDYNNAAKVLKCEVAVIKAVAKVESAGNGFHSNGEPVILFEGHKFHKYTNGKFTTPENENISHRKWSRKYYKENQHKRLQKAAELDRDAALMSASWGKFQIMGFNYKLCGFRTVQDFVNAMYKDEGKHLMSFVNFVINTGLSTKLRNKDWSGFARGYNGSSYKVNRYDTKMSEAYNRLSK